MAQELSFSLTKPFIPLIQLLKFLNVAESGAHASELVLSSNVYCNGKIELRKRYKVIKGDVIEIQGFKIKVS